MPLEDSDLMALMHAFKSFDTDGNGSLDKDEITTILYKISIGIPHEQVDLEVGDIMDAADKDKSGFISYAELFSARKKREFTPRAEAALARLAKFAGMSAYDQKKVYEQAKKAEVAPPPPPAADPRDEELAKLREALKEKTGELDSERDSLKRVESNLKHTDERANALNSELDALRATVKRQDAHIEQRQERITELERILAASANRKGADYIAQLANALARLTADYHTMQASLIALQEQRVGGPSSEGQAKEETTDRAKIRHSINAEFREKQFGKVKLGLEQLQAEFREKQDQSVLLRGRFAQHRAENPDAPDLEKDFADLVLAEEKIKDQIAALTADLKKTDEKIRVIEEETQQTRNLGTQKLRNVLEMVIEEIEGSKRRQDKTDEERHTQLERLRDDIQGQLQQAERLFTPERLTTSQADFMRERLTFIIYKYSQQPQVIAAPKKNVVTREQAKSSLFFSLTCLFFFVFGIFTYISHIFSVIISLVMIHRGLLKGKKGWILALCFGETIAWTALAALGWLNFHGDWYGYIPLVVWWVVMLLLGIPRLMFTFRNRLRMSKPEAIELEHIRVNNPTGAVEVH